MEETIYDLLTKIQEKLNSSMGDAKKSDKGNRSAGIRLRKSMLEVKELATIARSEVIRVRQTD